MIAVTRSVEKSIQEMLFSKFGISIGGCIGLIRNYRKGTLYVQFEMLLLLFATKINEI